MATVKGPLFSLSATGSVADQLTYQDQKGRSVVKRFSKPSNPRSPAQVDSRLIASKFSSQWAELTPEAQASWLQSPDADRIGAYAAFLRFNMTETSRRRPGCMFYGEETLAPTLGPPTNYFNESIPPYDYVRPSVTYPERLFYVAVWTDWQMPDSSVSVRLSHFLFSAEFVAASRYLYFVPPVEEAIPLNALILFAGTNNWGNHWYITRYE